MDFDFSDEQYELRTAIRDYVNAEMPTTLARELWDDPRGFSDRSWTSMASLGWLGLTLPESCSGSGLGAQELVLVSEAMGTVVAPGPFWSTVALGVELVRAAASDLQRDKLLSQVADGSARLTAAIAEESGRWDADAMQLEAQADGEGWVLSGQKLFVPDARSCSTLLLAARLGDGVGVFSIDPAATGLSIEAMATVDGSRKFDAINLTELRVAADALLGGRALSNEDFDAALDPARLALAAELAGIAEASLALTVEYTGVREQFGRALATFQALQHKCADMKVNVENTKSLVYYAAWALDEKQPDARRAVAMAKAYASEVCPDVVAEAIQVHGGIGFTWEHDLHMFFKRAKADESLLGDVLESREFVARDLGLG